MTNLLTPAGRDPAQPLTNAMTVDLEEYFQVSAFAAHISRDDWHQYPSRVEHSTERVLSLLERHATRATFFALGWVAERHPDLLRAIADAGHEVASHGFSHVRVSEQSGEQFREDVERTKKLLEDITGRLVNGFRAPSFSIGDDNLWALDVLQEAGYLYSSSIYPVRHDHYGVPQAPRSPFRHRPGGLLEVPISTVVLMSRNVPCGGGGYFRLYPYGFSRWALRRVNREGRTGVFYFHPWELDPDQPRQKGIGARTRFRHYLNLQQMEGRLSRLLGDFSWSTMEEVFLGSSLGESAAVVDATVWKQRAPA